MPPFFGLNYDSSYEDIYKHKNLILTEVYYLVKHCNFSRKDALKMPVYERQFFLKQFVKEKELEKEEYDKINNNSKSFK